MQLAFAVGVAATLVGLGGYVVGLFVAYPGRAFSLTSLMFGVTLALASRTEAT